MSDIAVDSRVERAKKGSVYVIAEPESTKTQQILHSSVTSLLSSPDCYKDKENAVVTCSRENKSKTRMYVDKV